jgi:hypothetical protein
MLHRKDPGEVVVSRNTGSLNIDLNDVSVLEYHRILYTNFESGMGTLVTVRRQMSRLSKFLAKNNSCALPVS